MSWSIRGSGTTDALDPSIVNTGANSISAMINFVTLSEARVGGSHYPLSTFHYSLQLGGRPQAASLVRGDTPRNAPLQNHAPPTVRRIPSSAAQPRWRLPTEYAPPNPESYQRSRASQRRSNTQRQCHQERATAILKIPIHNPANPDSDSKQTGLALDRVFFVALSGPSWIKRVLPLHFSVQTNDNEP